LAPQVTTLVNAIVNLDSRSGTLASASFDPNDPLTFHDSTAVSVYDSLGNQHTLQTYYVKTAANTWDVFASINGTQIDPDLVTAGVQPVSTLTFNSSGALTGGSPLSVDLTVATGAVSPFTVDIDYTSSTQFGAAFSVNTLNQDGYTSGRLSGFNIAADGFIQGRYTNGQSAVLGRIVLANFANPNGLQPLGDNQWAETSTSGSPLVGVPDSGSLGVLQASAVEDSNVDLTAELVNLITAQRVYQANAQTIQAQDTILQTLVNL
ncbi:MAG: flagellar hook protein FlgE, partial [Pseudomonadota bacterium]